eukprot:5808521-Pleurochrysis_carterae.AAC.1
MGRGRKGIREGKRDEGRERGEEEGKDGAGETEIVSAHLDADEAIVGRMIVSAPGNIAVRHCVRP